MIYEVCIYAEHVDKSEKLLTIKLKFANKHNLKKIVLFRFLYLLYALLCLNLSLQNFSPRKNYYSHILHFNRKMFEVFNSFY